MARRTPLLSIAAPVGLGLWSLGLAFCLVVVHAGLAWWWAPVFTAVVYAGSLEFLLVGLAVAGAPLLHVASTTLIVNLRHVFYALSFPLDRVHALPAKVYSTYALTDEAYAVTSAQPERLDLTPNSSGAVHLSSGLGVGRNDRRLGRVGATHRTGARRGVCAHRAVRGVGHRRVPGATRPGSGRVCCRLRGLRVATGPGPAPGVGLRRLHRGPRHPTGVGAAKGCS